MLFDETENLIEVETLKRNCKRIAWKRSLLHDTLRLLLFIDLDTKDERGVRIPPVKSVMSFKVNVSFRAKIIYVDIFIVCHTK